MSNKTICQNDTLGGHPWVAPSGYNHWYLLPSRTLVFVATSPVMTPAATGMAAVIAFIGYDIFEDIKRTNAIIKSQPNYELFRDRNKNTGLFGMTPNKNQVDFDTILAKNDLTDQKEKYAEIMNRGGMNAVIYEVSKVAEERDMLGLGLLGVSKNSAKAFRYECRIGYYNVYYNINK